MRNTVLAEVCVGSVESALAAQAAGAARVEFCSGLIEGGTTPSIAQIEPAKIFLGIPLYAMIRPRGGDFLYSNMEFEIMKSEVNLMGHAGCDGVVIGILKKDGTVDKARCSELIEVARKYNMGVTFNRAFDRCSDLTQALEDIVEIGCERVLTSGGEESAIKGSATIKKLIDQAAGRIVVMPAAGITPDNIAQLVRDTGLTEFHGTFQSLYNGDMAYRTTRFDDGLAEYSLLRTDPDKVREAINSANNL